jgi:hypothetical protein
VKGKWRGRGRERKRQRRESLEVAPGSAWCGSDRRLAAAASAKGRRRGSGPSWAEQLGKKRIGPLGPDGRWANFRKR